MSLVLMLALAACGGGGGGGGGGDATSTPAPAPTASIGPIPEAEFATVRPPTFNQAIAAFRTVTTANPALLANEPALSRALFDEVKRTTVNGAAGTERAAKQAEASARPEARGVSTRRALFNLDARLTLEEWKLVITSPLASARAATTIEPSAQAAIDSWPCEAAIDYFDGKADALRHAYWNALMTRRTSAAFAEAFATAHEAGSGNTAAASAMDQHNNALGRALALRFPAASDAELLALLLQQAQLFVAAGTAIPPSWSGLVFIAEAARQPLDGDYAGTITEDAAGTTWALRLSLAQCGALVRGSWRATREGAVVERRFEGTFVMAASLTLTVADPLPFEPNAGASPCLGMQLALAGTLPAAPAPVAFDGRWSSASCPSGGRVSLSR